MDIKKYESDQVGVVGIKLSDEERSVLRRAAQATVRAVGKNATEAAVKASQAAKGETPVDTDAAAEAKTQANRKVMAIGTVTKRIVENRPPVSFREVEGGIAVEVGEEGYTVLEPTEVDVAQDFLQHYADTTVEAVEGYAHDGGLNTSAWERAHYGQVADTMAAQLRGAIEPPIAS